MTRDRRQIVSCVLVVESRMPCIPIMAILTELVEILYSWQLRKEKKESKSVLHSCMQTTRLPCRWIKAQNITFYWQFLRLQHINLNQIDPLSKLREFSTYKKEHFELISERKNYIKLI